jgi:hypothetical protein
MAVIRMLLQVIGVLAVLMGLLWIGQGMGYINWPASSFMIGASTWSTRGLMLAIAGAAMILVGRRIGR